MLSSFPHNTFASSGDGRSLVWYLRLNNPLCRQSKPASREGNQGSAGARCAARDDLKVVRIDASGPRSPSRHEKLAGFNDWAEAALKNDSGAVTRSASEAFDGVPAWTASISCHLVVRSRTAASQATFPPLPEDLQTAKGARSAAMLPSYPASQGDSDSRSPERYLAPTSIQRPLSSAADRPTSQLITSPPADRKLTSFTSGRTSSRAENPAGNFSVACSLSCLTQPPHMPLLPIRLGAYHLRTYRRHSARLCRPR